MKAITFRPYQCGRDTPDLYDYMRGQDTQRLFSHTFQIPTIQLFERWITERLQKTYHDFFMLEYAEKTIGFTFSYDFFPNDRHCKFTLCLYPQYVSSGLGVIAGAQMLHFLFSSYSINQVFTSVFGYNEASIRLNLRSGFQQVGILPNYRYENGQYWPLYYFVIDRTEFYKNADHLLTRIDRKDD